MPQQKKPKGRARRRTAGRDLDAVQVAANSHIVRHYPIGCLGGQPRRLVGKNGDQWMVPIVLTSPGHGAVGEVGFVIVSAGRHQVVGSTEREAVGRAIKLLKESKGDELEAAFHRSRKG